VQSGTNNRRPTRVNAKTPRVTVVSSANESDWIPRASHMVQFAEFGALATLVVFWGAFRQRKTRTSFTRFYSHSRTLNRFPALLKNCFRDVWSQIRGTRHNQMSLALAFGGAYLAPGFASYSTIAFWYTEELPPLHIAAGLA